MLNNRGNKSPEIIEMLAANEEGVAILYRGYANAFPALREFWLPLADEELQHACWIRNLDAATGSNSMSVNETRFNVNAIRSFNDYLENELARLNERNIPLIEALSTTSYIEQSLIEAKFFEVFETDSTEIKDVLTKIRNDTTAHRNRAKTELEKFKKY
jgi:hypothetical protein